MKQKSSKRSCLLRGVISFVVILIIVLYVIFPVAMGVIAIFPGQETVGAPPDDFDPITLTTDDNVTLAGWYAPPSNSAAIILLHGAGGSREQLRPLARLLTEHGYGVLALDLRGHGASDGKTNRLGWQGSRDVAAAVKFLQTQPNVQFIGGLGLSMGGEVLLGAASDLPAVTAIVADGATRRCTEELLALPSERPLVRNYTARVMYATVQILSGEKPPKPLLDSMVEAETTQSLLITGGAEAQEVAFNQLFADTLGVRADLWIAPNAGHVGAYNLYPQEYEQRVLEFFEKTLLAEKTAP